MEVNIESMQLNLKNKTLLEWAVYYSQLGWSIFPVGQDKKPLLDWKKYQSEFPTSDDINTWFIDPNTKGIGIATGSLSKLFVLDIDQGANTDGLHLSPTLTVKTGGGGWHYYYKYPANTIIRNSAGLIREHIDIRAEGGYVIAPPSLHLSGNHYEWCDALAPDDIEIAAIPDWLLGDLISPFTTKKNFSEIAKGVNEGQRNELGAALVGKLLLYLPEDEWALAWEYLVGWNQRNNPPLPFAELKNIFQSITEKELKNRDPKTRSERAKPLSVEQIFAMKLETRPFLVDLLVPEKGLACFSGESNGGKGWVTLHIAHCIATGQPAFGKFTVKQGGVLIIDEEAGTNEFHRRMIMFGIKPEDKIYLYSQGEFKVDLKDDLQHLVNTAKDLEIKLVIFDPFSAIHLKTENSADEMQKVMSALQQFNLAGISVIFIHHHRKEHFMNKRAQASSGLRGSTVLFTRPDSHVAIKKDNQGEDGLRISIEQTKIRGGSPAKPFNVELKFEKETDRASFIYVGEIQEDLIKKEAAKDFIKSQLAEESPQTRIELITKANVAKVSGKTFVEIALKEMTDNGSILAQTKPGKGKKLFYSLPQNYDISSEEEESREMDLPFS